MCPPKSRVIAYVIFNNEDTSGKVIIIISWTVKTIYANRWDISSIASYSQFQSYSQRHFKHWDFPLATEWLGSSVNLGHVWTCFAETDFWRMSDRYVLQKGSQIIMRFFFAATSGVPPCGRLAKTSPFGSRARRSTVYTHAVCIMRNSLKFSNGCSKSSLSSARAPNKRLAWVSAAPFRPVPWVPWVH